MDARPPADAERASKFRRRHGPPTNEIPVASPAAGVLARTDDVAVVLTGAGTYRSGVAFALAVRVRKIPGNLRTTDLHRAVNGHPDPDASGPDARILLGVEFADGRRADNLRGVAGMMQDGDEPTLMVAGSSGGGGSAGTFVLDARCWVTPVPPDGPVTFVVAWPALGVAEAAMTLPDATFTRDSGAAVELWPEPAEAPSRPATPRTPDLPAGSWFAR